MNIFRSTASAAAVLITATAFAAGALADGPFGISMGDKPETHGCVTAARRLGPGYFYCPIVPRPYPDASSYTVMATDKTGICAILAKSREIATSDFGEQLRDAVNEVAEHLATAYGAGEKSDFLLPGSMWKDPRYWLTGLQAQERTYAYIWRGKKMKNNIDFITVGADSVANRTGTFLIVFDFTNKAACDNELKKAKTKAF